MEKKELAATLKKEGIQVTPQRLAILEQLKLRKDHPSAEMLFNEIKDEFPSLTLATVYNTLEKLRTSGLCMEVNPLHVSARYDGNTAAHLHAVCNNCQRVVDVHDASVSIEPPEWLSKEFAQVNHNVIFYGLCEECQKPSDEIPEKHAEKEGRQVCRTCNKYVILKQADQIPLCCGKLMEFCDGSRNESRTLLTRKEK